MRDNPKPTVKGETHLGYSSMDSGPTESFRDQKNVAIAVRSLMVAADKGDFVAQSYQSRICNSVSRNFERATKHLENVVTFKSSKAVFPAVESYIEMFWMDNVRGISPFDKKGNQRIVFVPLTEKNSYIDYLNLKIAERILSHSKNDEVEAVETLKRLREFIGKKPVVTAEKIRDCLIQIIATAIIEAKATEDLWEWFSHVNRSKNVAAKMAEEKKKSQRLEVAVENLTDSRAEVTIRQIAKDLTSLGYKTTIPAIRYHMREYRKKHIIQSSLPGQKYRLNHEEYQKVLSYLKRNMRLTKNSSKDSKN